MFCCDYVVQVALEVILWANSFRFSLSFSPLLQAFHLICELIQESTLLLGKSTIPIHESPAPSRHNFVFSSLLQAIGQCDRQRSFTQWACNVSGSPPSHSQQPFQANFSLQPLPPPYTPPPSTGNSSRSGICEFKGGDGVTILTFAISDLGR